MFTIFWDMYSGGGLKEPPYSKIYIEAPQEEAKIIFYNRFGHNPNRVTCTCCGEDYSISEEETFELASAFHRNCLWDNTVKNYVEEPNRRYNNCAVLISVEDYKKQPDVLIIYKEEIKPEERQGNLPKQGYVWID